MDRSLYESCGSQDISDGEEECAASGVGENCNDLFVVPACDSRSLRNIDLMVRVLRSKKNLVIAPKSGRVLATNVNILGDLTFNIRQRIVALEHHWMCREVTLNITVKTVSISPYFRGRLVISIYNNSNTTIRIPPSTAMAQLLSTNFDM